MTMKEKILFQISKEDKNLIKTYAKQMRISLSAYIRYKLFQNQKKRFMGDYAQILNLRFSFGVA